MGATSHTILYSWLFLSSTESNFSTTIERQHAGVLQVVLTPGAPNDTDWFCRTLPMSLGEALWLFLFFGLNTINEQDSRKK